MKNQLVFIESQSLDAVPFTTSDLVAEGAGVQHHAVQQLLSKYEDDFAEFGALAFEMRKVTRNGGTNYEKICQLNEEQATLLITYLQNTPQVRSFKKNLVRQFYLMRKQLIDRRVIREKGKIARRALTDAVRDSGTGKWTYKHLTDLTYRAITGMDAAHLRVERGAGRTATVKDYLAPDELQSVEKLESQVAVLLDLGMEYSQIKETVINRRQTKLTSHEVDNCHSLSTKTSISANRD